jgi:hypothetical protein
MHLPLRRERVVECLSRRLDPGATTDDDAGASAAAGEWTTSCHPSMTTFIAWRPAISRVFSPSSSPEGNKIALRTDRHYRPAIGIASCAGARGALSTSAQSRAQPCKDDEPRQQKRHRERHAGPFSWSWSMANDEHSRRVAMTDVNPKHPPHRACQGIGRCEPMGARAEFRVAGQSSRTPRRARALRPG